jgi:hypothetical protein
VQSDDNLAIRGGAATMGKIKNPTLFSQEFGIDPKRLVKLGLLDPILNGDTRLFIDPVLLSASKNAIIKEDGYRQFKDYFGNVIRLLQHSKSQGDVPWRNSARHLKLDEIPELCLGYGGNTTRGRDVALTTQRKILATAKEIIDLGVLDPELFSLVGLLEEGVGPDTIGDMTAHAILGALVKITAEAAKELEVRARDSYVEGIEAKLPHNRFSSKPILLVPLDILRDLPVALDWSDISTAASENQKIRTRVNDFIGNIWKLTTKKQKDQVRAAALANKEAFKALLDAAYLLREDSYDFAADPEGHRIFRDALTEFSRDYPLQLVTPRKKDGSELRKLVDQIVSHFRTLVEINGLNYLLWQNGIPRKEKAAQRLFFAVADVYCKANDIDISPESDSGGGPVDFKFSSGYSGRVLVEIKLSKGTVVHGYKVQLGVYTSAAQTFESIFLVIDVGGMRNKLEEIIREKNRRAGKGQRTPDIVIVDATKKPSASKR